MVKVLEEGADLSGYEVLKCTADGALCGSRMVELERVKDGEKIWLAVGVAGAPPKPLDQVSEEAFGHYSETTLTVKSCRSETNS